MEEFLIKVFDLKNGNEVFTIECNSNELVKKIQQKLDTPVFVHEEYLYTNSSEIRVYELDEILNYVSLI
jgi:hypothetical protein